MSNNRYSSTPIKNRWDGKRVYLTTYYPIIPEQDSDLLIISQDGDYLDYLSYKYYGDPSLYWIIALANSSMGVGKGRLSIKEGLQLRIPVNISNILTQFNTLNSQ